MQGWNALLTGQTADPATVTLLLPPLSVFVNVFPCTNLLVYALGGYWAVQHRRARLRSRCGDFCLDRISALSDELFEMFLGFAGRLFVQPYCSL